MADGFADGVVAGMASNDRGYGYGGGFGYGGDWIWVIVLFALFGNGGFGGFGGGNGQFPWILQGQNDTDALVTAGFNQAATASQLSAIQNSLNTMEISNCGRAMDAMQTAYQNQITDLQSDFAMQQAFSNCCFEQRLGLADLKSTILAENCADRAALSDGIRDILTNQNSNTQRILDQMCQDKIDQKNEKIAELQRELTMSNLAASQTAQTARILQDNAAQTVALEQYLNPVPVPAYVVPSPRYGYYYGNTGCGCGCNNTNI